MSMPLDFNYLYVALQYPENPDVDYESRPEWLPARLRTLANGKPEHEYTWSFMFPLKLNGEVIVKRYALISQADVDDNPGVMTGCLPNEHLRKHGCYVEKCIRNPGTLEMFPRLMVLLRIQRVDMYSFETFLCNHNNLTHWTLLSQGIHAPHQWARNVLVDYNGVNIDEDTIKKVEEGARTALRKHKRLKRKNHDWTAVKGTPPWRVYIYDAGHPGCCR